MTTITLYKYIQSELIKKGFNEFLDEHGNLVFFDDEFQFMQKVLSYDDDVASIVDHLFTGFKLENVDHDKHFKKGFLYKFINRQINRQTIESFRLELMSTFMINENYINRIYTDLEKYLIQTKINDQKNLQTNKETTEQNSDITNTTDNREAEATLPQNNVQLDVDSTVMDSADNNRITRNKQSNIQSSTGETTGDTSGETTGTYNDYRLDELFKTRNLHEDIYRMFDEKCFLQGGF